MKMNKNFKIWGVSYGLIGDLVMGLPVLTYFEKKYPDSYKYFVIQQKCSQCVPLFLNHQLIDRIKITDDWEHFGDEDLKIYESCQVKVILNQNHPTPYWYNDFSCVEETARLAGIFDIKDVLDEEEMKPRLKKWFPTGLVSSANHGYTQTYDNSHNKLSKVISIWPFAQYGMQANRSPSLDWWRKMVSKFFDVGIYVYHMGYMTEPTICSEGQYFKRFTDLSFFDQIKLSLGTKLTIGTDSGVMWALGAYSHPAIHLMTYWMPGHLRNPDALSPVNDNGITLFEPDGCDNISHKKVLEEVLTKIKN